MNSSYSSKKQFKVGETIMCQGDKGESAYIIENGLVEIRLERKSSEDTIVGTRGAGSMIGEMSLIDNAPRTATIIAIEDCTLLEITVDDFSRRLENADPVLRMTMQVILTRYRDTLKRSNMTTDTNNLWPMAETVERSYLDQEDAVEKIRISNAFNDALKNNEIQLYYQPLINFKTGEIDGFEALMRWIHPEKGFISPGLFIPIIEENGQILEASKWAFRESCNALKRIQERSGYHAPLHMSVNFSSTDFSSDGFVENIYNTISETDVPVERIHLEITERLLMAQPETAKETLNMCRKAGMGISIDDFGTGYSSLSYLHSFPINILKVDQSFVRDMDKNPSSSELVRSIVSLGKNLDMSIVAEGVETLEEAQVLKEMGCDFAQGYYFAKPMPEKDVTETVRLWKPKDI
jgi:EAL domain-containing protein (putative c-di-GMP-specific phosphodiesterase class I)